MRLRRFQVQGFKNFVNPVVLDDLGPFNVIHGDNNVGKSNLLESIGLFFVAMQALREESKDGPSIGERYERRTKSIDLASIPAPEGATKPRWAIRSSDYFTSRGFPTDELFNFEKPAPVVLEACIELDRRDGDPKGADGPVIPRLRLERIDTEVMITLLELSVPPENTQFGYAFASVDDGIAFLLARLGPQTAGKEMRLPYFLLRSDRTVIGDESEPLVARSPLPRTVARSLYLIETAKDTRRQEFQRFVGLLECVRDLVGPGTWRMEYDLETDRAELVLEKDLNSPRVPLRSMGSGIQQVALLCARLVVNPADIVAIEEPELNLRWSVQRTLHDLLLKASQASEHPQFFLTSHSGQFEDAAASYLLTRTNAGPGIRKTSTEIAREYTQPQVTAPPAGARAPQSYVTTEGLVQIPADIRQKLGLGQGGGVVFIEDNDGHFRMLTNDQFFDLFEKREPAS